MPYINYINFLPYLKVHNRHISFYDLPLLYPFQTEQTQHLVVCFYLVVLLLGSTADQVYGP